MSLPTRLKVQKLQAALRAKTKGAPSSRFYALYDKVYRADVLVEAYEHCRSNSGAAGIDGQRVEDIEADGLEKGLGERAQELRDKSYRPQAVRRVYIPKPNGKQRPLGIPTVRDRVVQAAVVLVHRCFPPHLDQMQHLAGHSRDGPPISSTRRAGCTRGLVIPAHAGIQAGRGGWAHGHRCPLSRG